MTFVLFLIKKETCHFLGLWRWECGGGGSVGGGGLRAAQQVRLQDLRREFWGARAENHRARVGSSERPDLSPSPSGTPSLPPRPPSPRVWDPP